MSNDMVINEFDALNESQTSWKATGLPMLWRRKLPIVVGVLFCLTLGFIYYQKQPPVYRSTAQVLTVREESNINIARTFHLDDYVFAQARLFASPLIVKRALDEGMLPPLIWVGQRDPTSAIVESLSATAKNGNILTVSFDGPEPIVCRQVLEAIITSYEGFLNETLHRKSEDAARYVTGKAEKVHKKLEEDRIHYEQLQESLPPIWEDKNGNTANPQDLALALERELLPLRLKEQMLLEEFKVDNPHVRRLLRSVGREIELKRKLHHRVFVSGITTVQQDRMAAIESQRYGLKLQRMELESHQRVLEQAEDSAVSSGNHSAKAKNVNTQAEAYLQLLLEEIKRIELSDRALVEMFEKEHAEAERLTNLQNEVKQLNSEIARTENFHETLMNQLQQINLGKELSDYRTCIIAPATLGVRVGPSAGKILGAAAIWGILFGIGFAYLVDITDKGFHTPDEICHRLGLPAIGLVPLLNSNQEARLSTSLGREALDPTLLDYRNSTSSHAEAFRKVRMALLFGVHGGMHQVIQITSPNVGDGKTTIAANLAVSMAQAGKRTLLIDANLRRPQIHKLFGLSTEAGLATVLAGDVELRDVIHKSGVSGLTIVPCGRVPSNPAELLTSPRFEALIEVVRDEYEIVIVDTPSLLDVSDPCVVAHSAERVLLAIRINQRSRFDAEKAIETMGPLAAKLTGVVINNMDGRWRPSPPKLLSASNRVVGHRQERGPLPLGQHATRLGESPSAPATGALGDPGRQSEPAAIHVDAAAGVDAARTVHTTPDPRASRANC